MERRTYCIKKTNAMKIQSWMRMKLAQKSYRSLLEQRWNSAVKIQTYIKMHLQRIKFKNLLKATLILQKNFRMWSAQSQLKNLKLERHRLLERSAILIQTHFRSHLARQLLYKMKVFSIYSSLKHSTKNYFLCHSLSRKGKYIFLNQF